jgi:hypothetical protein
MHQIHTKTYTKFSEKVLHIHSNETIVSFKKIHRSGNKEQKDLLPTAQDPQRDPPIHKEIPRSEHYRPEELLGIRLDCVGVGNPRPSPGQIPPVEREPVAGPPPSLGQIRAWPPPSPGQIPLLEREAVRIPPVVEEARPPSSLGEKEGGAGWEVRGGVVGGESPVAAAVLELGEMCG